MPTKTVCLQCKVDDVFNPDVRVGLRDDWIVSFPSGSCHSSRRKASGVGCVGQNEEISRHALSALRRRGQASMRVSPRGARVMEGLKAGGATKEEIDRRVGGLGCRQPA